MGQAVGWQKYKCMDCGEEWLEDKRVDICVKCKSKGPYRKNKTNLTDFSTTINIEQIETVLSGGIQKGKIDSKLEIGTRYQNTMQDFVRMIDTLSEQILGDLKELVDPHIILRDKAVVVFRPPKVSNTSNVIDLVGTIASIKYGSITASEIIVIKPIQRSPYYTGRLNGDYEKREIAYHKIVKYKPTDLSGIELIDIINDILVVNISHHLALGKDWNTPADYLWRHKGWMYDEFKVMYERMRRILLNMKEFRDLTPAQTLIKVQILKSYDRNIYKVKDFLPTKVLKLRNEDIKITKQWLKDNHYNVLDLGEECE